MEEYLVYNENIWSYFVHVCIQYLNGELFY